MNLVVLDIECIENKIVKELGVCILEFIELWAVLFFHSKISKQHLNLRVRSIFMKSTGAVIMKKILPILSCKNYTRNKFATRKTTGSPKSSPNKISKKNIRTHTKKNFNA